MTTTIDTLETAWKQWCDFLQQRGVVPSRCREPAPAHPDAYRAIHERFLGFSERHPAAPEHLHATLVALSKGTHLVRAALAWDEAVAGPNGNASGSPANRARGEQWRLVMACGGLEPMIDSLLPSQHHFPSYPERIRYLAGRCSLPDYTPLEAPSQHRPELARWLEAEATFGEHPILSFLGLHNGDARIFRTWAVDGQPIESWPEAVLLAKALRNATAHGSLSASKVYHWGLRGAFAVLTTNIGEIAAGALRRLLSPACSETACPELTAGSSQKGARVGNVK